MGLSRQLSLILGGAAQCTFLVGSAIPVLLMDRFGRRSLLMACSAGLCLCFICVAGLLSNPVDGRVPEGRGYAAVAFIFIFQLFYGVGWLPVPWFYPSEIATTRTRTKVQAIASGWNWMFVFVVVKITPIAFGECTTFNMKRHLLTVRSKHRLAHFHNLRRAQRIIHPDGLLLLPGDEGHHARRHTSALPQKRYYRWCVFE